MKRESLTASSKSSGVGRVSATQSTSTHPTRHYHKYSTSCSKHTLCSLVVWDFALILTTLFGVLVGGLQTLISSLPLVPPHERIRGLDRERMV